MSLAPSHSLLTACLLAAALTPVSARSQDGAHWSLQPPARPAPPPTRDAGWPRGDLDRFVLAALEQRGARPTPEADAATLLRRISLDLTGLPPTPAEVEAFAADPSDAHYARVVERLLASPHYGERWARPWLDLARYADTNGYEKDRRRSMWPWRDWVIDALNADLPFDQFTIEQLAGDMLPNATPRQHIATGFHRNSMINEEGGIDVEEFRYAAVVDRVGTTATTWLGLTVGCAQCHDHKFDKISQRDFYGLLAIFDNCDEIVLKVDEPQVRARRERAQTELERRRQALRDLFPPPMPETWSTWTPTTANSEAGAELAIDPDGSVRADGKVTDRDLYTLEGPVRAGSLLGVRIEALVDARDPARGPGRTPHGNFVLTELEVSIVGRDGSEQRLALAAAAADAEQSGFPAGNAVDGDQGTGWAIHSHSGGAEWRRDRAARFVASTPLAVAEGSTLRAVLQQNYGGRHTLARCRASLAYGDGFDLAKARERHREVRFAQWLEARQRTAQRWQVVAPEQLQSAGDADFALQTDGSVLLYGNNPDRDTTTLRLATLPDAATGLRIEALTHDTLPAHGPGRSMFFPEGGFTISDLRARVVAADGSAVRDVAFASASASYEHREHPAGHAIDAAPDTGWTNEGNVGRAQHAVFALREPLRLRADEQLELTIAQHSIHNNNLGRFRLAVSVDPAPRASALPHELEAMLARGTALAADERDALLQHFVETTPELAGAQADLRRRERDLPALPTTLALREREAARARQTPLRQRGEFTRPRDLVAPAGLACLPPIPAPVDRLSFARWLVDGKHPLTARVVVNRAWEAFFGRGLVATSEDFGTRGERPSHPELLDWLAHRLMDRGWSMKALHREIVLSATYRQGAQADASAWQDDPDNRWLGRAPRLRLPAEAVRDQALAVAGLLTAKVGGPSVFPPQPQGVGDLSYGRLEWKVSEGAERYRRGLYTFAKRTAPYPMHALFDAPSGETCIARRARTDTPLQALTLLNDPVFVEAAEALGKLVCSEASDDRARIAGLFRRALARQPSELEARSLAEFAARRRAAKAGPPDEAAERAVWTAVSRVVLNLDEAITRG